MTSVPRIAFLTDTFHEVNGVALTSRELEAFARRRDYPMLCVYGGDTFERWQHGSITHIQLKRGPLAVRLDTGMRQDFTLWRYMPDLSAAIARFNPDVIHITSPGDVGELGAALARRLKIPLVISWHTNFHEFGARRLDRFLGWVPGAIRTPITRKSEKLILKAVLRFYRMGRILFAPNAELVRMLEACTGRPAFLMKRGVDTELFSPVRRQTANERFRLGYVGRITPEKNVRFLVELQHGLARVGVRDFEIVVIGDGSERAWLQANLASALFPGILRGRALAEAYASMDLFVFPSKTDTFGNVVLEALASGVPCVVTDQGGPKFIIDEGVNGFAAATDPDFVARVVEIMTNPDLQRRLSEGARDAACLVSWDRVFEQVYEGYCQALPAASAREILREAGV